MKSQSQSSNWKIDSLDAFVGEILLSKSEKTVEAYKYDVSKFLDYVCESKNVKRISGMRSEYITSYLGYCKSRGKSESSLNRYYMSISSYCKFLRRTKQVAVDLTEDVPVPKTSQKAPRILTASEVNLVLSAPNVQTESGMRDRAILELLYSSGLRASELCDLELKDVQERQVVVSCGKRGKTRSVPITSEARYWIDLYVTNFRGKLPGYLFLTVMKKKLVRQLLCKVVNNYAKEMGVDGITTHSLRHACATHLLDNGADLMMIKEVLGHSSIASTQRYTHLSTGKIQEMFHNFHPRKAM